VRFRLKKGKGSVGSLTDAAGLTYAPGDIVDLPASYDGEAWLERVDPAAAEEAAPGKMEPAEPAAAVPLPGKTRKKPRS
jgi:hypothetical protein